MPHDGWHPHDESRAHHHHHRHGPPTRRTVLAAAALLPFGSASAQTVDAAQRIADAANRFLLSLDEAQRRKAMIAFDSDNRLDWHYVPRSRPGLALAEMRAGQADAARALFASVLNQRGLDLLDGVRLLEGVLREQQGSFRDPDRYHVSVFGTPGRFPWGWRFEGHHLSFNFTVVDGKHVFFAPSFMGTNPAEVRAGPRKGERVLADEEDLGLAFVNSLDADQKKIAIFAPVALKEIVTTNDKRVGPLAPAGITAAQLKPAQRAQLFALVKTYLARWRPDLADEAFAKIETAGLDTLAFGWAGGLDRTQQTYYRIQGPTFLIEFDNFQGNGNHVHTVVRDFKGDFGHDLLAAHYAKEHAKK